MDTLTLVLLFVLAIVAGALSVYFVFKTKQKSAEARLHEKDLLIAEKEKQISDKEQQLKEKDAQLVKQLEQQKESMAALQARFNETIDKIGAQAKNATEEMLKARQKEFAESSQGSIGQIVNPLKETIKEMKEAMDKSTLKQSEISSAMKANIDNMLRQSEAAKLSADELTRVFKHGSKVQGDWGETVLAELLDSQGLTCGIHYDTQVTMRDASGKVLKSEDGSMMRPDVILHLDKEREVIIDSKVSLTAFMDYVNAEDEIQRQTCLKAHIASLESHVKELSVKNYSAYIVPPKVKMDYVIMFVPHSGALWTALNAKPDLWRKAMDKNVFIADEQTLFAALRIINLTWKQIALAQNHEQVYELANEMLNRVGLFLKEYNNIGKALNTASKCYEDGRKKLRPEGQSILQTCSKLQKLGARESDKNPLNLPAEVETVLKIEE